MNSIMKTTILDDMNGQLQLISSGLSTVIISIFNRDSFQKYLLSENADRPGVYVLFNENIKTEEASVYIGEAESVGARLKQHDKLIQKSFWTKTIVMQETSGTLNKAHYKYLEYAFYLLAQESGTTLVINKVIPTKSSLSECDVFIAEDFLKTARNILSVFNYNFFEPLVSKLTDSNKDVYYIRNHGIEAKIRIKDKNTIILLPQSTGLLFGGTEVFQEMDKYKQKLLDDKYISEIAETNLFIVNKEIVFDSENEAYTFATLDVNTEGMYAWFNIEGLSMYDIFFKNKQ